MGGTKTITSRDNATFKALKALATDAREQRRRGKTLLDGPHLVGSYLEHVGSPELLVVSESGARHAEAARLLDALGSVHHLHLPDALFREVSGVATPVGVLAVVPIPEAPAELPREACVLLDAIQDSGNVGAILRTAAAAGVADVLLGPGCAGAWTPRVLRAAQGAHFVLRIREHADLAAVIAARGPASIAAVARDGVPLFDLDLSGAPAWIFGNEGVGVSEALAHAAGQRATIPMAPGNESLNVAAAAAICLFEGVRQRLAKGGRKHGND